jgi:hypothetical protein
MTCSELLPFLFAPDGAPLSLVNHGSAVRCGGRPVSAVSIGDDGVVMRISNAEDPDHIDAAALAEVLRDAVEDARLYAQELGAPEPLALPETHGIRLYTDTRGRLTLDIGVAIPARW